MTAIGWWLLTCSSLVLLPSSINGQSAVRYTLCKDRVVTVIPVSSGIIQYLQRASSTPINCTLVLRGFRNRSYVSLPELGMIDNNNKCGPEKTVNINNSSYCAMEGYSRSPVIIKLMKKELVVQLKSDNAVDFSFQFYSNGEY